jgi:hypothetical protein
MIWPKNREYLQIEVGDLELLGWEYKAMIDVFYLYLLAAILGISTGAFIVIINKKGQNRRKEIEKIPRGGDTPDPDSETDSSKGKKGKEEFYKFLYQMVYNRTDTGNCLQKSEVSKVMNTKTARKLYDSLKTSVKTSLQKKSIPIVVTAGTAILAHKVVLSLTLRLMGNPWPITISTALGSNISLLVINAVRLGIVFMNATIGINLIYNLMIAVGFKAGFSQFLAIYQFKEKAKGLLFAAILNSVSLSLQKRYCDNFIAPVADTSTSIEVVTHKPNTILLPDSSNSIYVLSSSSSLKLVLKDTPQCKLHVEDVLANYRTFNVKNFQNYLENQNKKCEKTQIVEIEPLSLKDFDMNTFKGTIDSEHWEILQKEAENEEKKVNKLFLDSSKPKRDLNCEKEAYEKTFEGRLETILGDLEEPSEMPIPIQTECSQNKINRKSKSVPLKKRTKTLADLKDETSTIPKMVEPKEAFRIPNENQK